jgi:serine protease Do
VVLAFAAGQLATSLDVNATPAPSSPTPAAEVSRLPSFAEIAQRVTPAVVNVAVVQNGVSAHAHPRMSIPEIPDGYPFGDLLRRFFDQRSALPDGMEIPHYTRGVGSGFIVDPGGLIVTNDHVVSGASEIQVTLDDGSQYQAKVRGRDPNTDLALIEIDADHPLPYVELGNSDTARVGDWVLAVGNPFGLGGSVTAGIVSARGRELNDGPLDGYLQIDAPINRGNSGGPLFDTTGRVIGVNTAIFSPSGGSVGIGFAVPSATARAVIDQLRANGEVRRGWLGVQIQPVTAAVAEGLGLDRQQGALVASVMDKSPAQRAGLRPGDVILKVDGQTIDGFKTLPRLIAGMSEGTQVPLEVYRKGASEKLSVVIGRMPADEPVAVQTETDVDTGTPRLGLYLAPLTPKARQAHGLDAEAAGVLVARVEPGSPAEKAGITPGSVISMVGQQSVDAPEALVEQVRSALKQDRSSVLLLVETAGEKRFVTVRFAA